jgi:hypothetical protein
MDLMQLFKKGNLGNHTINSEVTAIGHEIKGGNLSSLNNHEINSNPVKFKNRTVRAVQQKTAKPDNQTFVSCGKCLGFKSHNAHGKGVGYCLIGGDYGLWYETQHQCTKFDACVVIQDYVVTVGAATVTCYSPNGQAFELEARGPEHAA